MSHLYYRIILSPLSPNLSLRIHGTNEKISIQNYETQVKFMFELIQNADIEQTDVPYMHDL